MKFAKTLFDSLKEEPSVAIIILNWNGLNDTVDCLNSLEDITYANYKIVIVDNGSENNEGMELKTRFPKIHLIMNKINRGFCGGNNDGINWAISNGFDYIVNLNNDCIVEKEWLSNLIRGVIKSDVDFASSRIMFYPDTDLIFSDGDMVLPNGAGFSENRLKKYYGTNSTKAIFSACGAASLYSRRCLEAIKIKENQYFDELYFAYFEDIDIGFRLASKSFKGVLVPDAVVYHKAHKSTGEYSYFKLFNTSRNRVLNVLLNFPLWMIPVAEIYHFLKNKLPRFIPRALKSGNNQKSIPAILNIDFRDLKKKRRKWILNNIPVIRRNRLERKKNGLINSRIHKHLCWDMSKFIAKPVLRKIKK